MSAPAGLAPEMLQMVVTTLRQVLERDLSDERCLELDKKDIFPTELIQKLLSPEVGLHLIFLPESVGGLGGGARDICRVSEEMAAADLGVATAFLAICLGTDPILVGGTDEQKARWLTSIASDGLIVAYGVTEPEAGSNVAAVQTTAEPITDAAGEVTGYRLNGVKQFITNGGVADIYTILARAPGGPSFFVLERGTPGIDVGKKEEKHGIRASNTTSVLLEDVEVPFAHLVGGEEGQGLKQANAVFGYTRLMVGSFGLGGGQAALDRALHYAKTREQFGGPLLEKEGYLLKLIAPHWINLLAGRAFVEQVALEIDEGDRDKAVEGSIAKLWCTEIGIRAADAALQALGGYGYAREYMVEKYRRDVRITSIYEGTSEIQQSIIAMHRWKALVRSKGQHYEETVAGLDALHAEHGDVGAAVAAAALRGVAEGVMRAHEKKYSRHQRVQFTFADMITRAEIATALTRKAGRQTAAGATDAPMLAAASRVFARQTLVAVANEVRDCVAGFAATDDATADAEATALVEHILAGAPAGSLAGLWTDMAAVGEHLKSLA